MNAGAPVVSVVVAARNAEAHLDPCLRSLLAQDHPRERTEILVVDNGSCDATAAILARYAERVTVLEEAKLGPSAARNRGLRHARGTIVAFTDSDCVVEPSWLRHLIAPLEDPGVGVSGGRILAIDPEHPLERFGEEIHDHEKALTLYRPHYAITMSWASPRALLDRLGGFDESLLRCEDVDLAYRVAEAGYRLTYAPQAVVRHRNERTWLGLFLEGVAHGLHSVPLLRKHAALVRRHGHRRFDPRSWSAIARDLCASRSDAGVGHLRCRAVFNTGKKLGKVVGSVRFAHLEL